MENISGILRCALNVTVVLFAISTAFAHRKRLVPSDHINSLLSNTVHGRTEMGTYLNGKDG